MKNISRRNIGGFTLVEILVVVLIIGILSAVAVPMYQGAVDKSNFSTMLAPTRSLKEAQEGVRMATGNYTDNAEDLDVTLSQESLSYEFQTRDNGDEFNAIIATNPKLPNVRLARYLDENLLLAGQLHCQAKAGDDRANRLCGSLLIGQELKDIDGYISYLLDEEIDQPTCDYAGKSYSTSKTKCYKDTATRCDALGMPAIAGQDQCGYTDTRGQTVGEEGMCITSGSGGRCDNTTVKNGGICKVESNGDADWLGNVGCSNLIIEPGGKCIGDNAKRWSCDEAKVDQGEVICNNSRLCGWNGTYDNGSVCVANGGDMPCYAASFKNGSICYANSNGACKGYEADVSVYYDETSCCCGAYCPSTAPKCEASRCDPQYMK